jgi:hypothetical protein
MRIVSTTLVGAVVRSVALFVTCSLAAASAGAQDIRITGGGLLQTSTIFGGPLVLEGERGFTLTGVFGTVPYPVQQCGSGVCAPGQLVTLAADAVTPDLLGTVTLDGVTYMLRDDIAMMSARFDGSFVMPASAETATVAAPFLFGGVFRAYLASGAINVGFTGSGVATISLVASLTNPGSWRLTGVRYEFAALLPAPWQSADVGAVGMSGSAAMLNDTFIVAGDGADVWGTADAFRFACQTVAGGGSVTAHVGAHSVTNRIGIGPQQPSEFAKAGVMMRASIDPASASVILDVKPNGDLEFMVRYANGESTHFIAGATVTPHDVWLRLSREPGNQITATYSPDGAAWTSLGTVSVLFAADEILAGVAVTSHQSDTRYAALFDHVSVSTPTGPNLLVNGDFEAYDPPALGPPGWISDHAFRQSPAKSETHQPRSGAKNGACWSPESLDCGIYQDVVAPTTGTYSYTVYATADRAGGLVGANVDGLLSASNQVAPAPFGVYTRYTMSFTASAGDVIRVWMYSPASPGYVVIDDASLTLVPSDNPPPQDLGTHVPG